MHGFVYRTKIKTAATVLIVFFVIIILLQGILAVYNIYDVKNASLRISSLIVQKDIQNVSEIFSGIDSYVGIIETDESIIYEPASYISDDIVDDSKRFNLLSEKFRTMTNAFVKNLSFSNVIFFMGDELPLSTVAPLCDEKIEFDAYFGSSYIYRQSGIVDTPWYRKLEDNAESLIWVSGSKERPTLCFAKKLTLKIAKNGIPEFYPMGVLYVSFDLWSLLNQLELTKTYKTCRIAMSYNGEEIFKTGADSASGKNSLMEISSVYPGFNIITEIPSREINSPFVRQTAVSVVAMLVIILFGMLMLSYITNAVISPIMHMSKHFREDKHSALSYKKALTPEIDVLYKNHNYMVERTKEAMEESRKSYYKMLQAQINPHFTYNVLNTISSVSLMRGDTAIARTLANLVTMMRYGINSPESLARLRNEIDIIKTFCDIQNFRYNDNIDIVYDIPDELMDVMLPKLTLQPIVENSVFHNEINPATSQIRIFVEARKAGDNVVIKVKDSNSTDPEKLNLHIQSTDEDYVENRRGLGIRNISQRLSFVFGEEYNLKYTREDGMLCAVVTVPRNKTSTGQ